MHVCEWVCACGDQKRMLCTLLSHFPFIPLRQGLSQNLGLEPFQLDWKSANPGDLLVSIPLRVGVIGIYQGA